MKRSTAIIKAHLKTAKIYAELSYAKRLKVGAVIVKDGRIISVGRNGTPSGYNNNCETISDDGELHTKPEVVHSEANAILFAAKNGIKTNNSEIICTHSPCINCSALIVQSGIKKVYYETDYRDLEPLKFLSKCGIDVERITNES